MSSMLWAEDRESVKMEPEELWKLACLEWEIYIYRFWKPDGTRFQAELPYGLICQHSAVQGYIYDEPGPKSLLFRVLSSTRLTRIYTKILQAN